MHPTVQILKQNAPLGCLYDDDDDGGGVKGLRVVDIGGEWSEECEGGGNIMDGVDIEDLTIEQYLRLTQESQTPRKIKDMTITKYLEYEKKEFAHYFVPNQPGTESDYDSEDMEEEVEYMTDDEVVMSEQEESNHGYTQNIQHLEEKDDVDKWLNAEITKHMSMQGVENMKDVLISIIKSIRQEMKDDIMKRQFEASTASVSDKVSSIAGNKVDKVDDNTSNIAPCRLPKELSPGSFLLPFNINNHNFYATTTLDAKDNDEIARPDNLLPDKRGLVKRWHVCKPIHVTYDDGSGEDCGTWPTCDPDSKFCFGYNEVFGKIDDTTREQRIGHNNLHESDREFIFNEWILDSYDVKEEYAREIGNPYSRRFDEYNRVFNNEIEHLPNEYILRIGKKGYVLDDVWENVNKTIRKPMKHGTTRMQKLRGNYRDRLDP
ncbi:hypothetical protein Tco_1153637 [Tanacetum coccineum]